MFWEVLCHVFVPSSGLDENNIKGAFYPGVALAPLYPTKDALTFYSDVDKHQLRFNTWPVIMLHVIGSSMLFAWSSA